LFENNLSVKLPLAGHHALNDLITGSFSSEAGAAAELAKMKDMLP